MSRFKSKKQAKRNCKIRLKVALHFFDLHFQLINGYGRRGDDTKDGVVSLDKVVSVAERKSWERVIGLGVWGESDCRR